MIVDNSRRRLGRVGASRDREIFPFGGVSTGGGSTPPNGVILMEAGGTFILLEDLSGWFLMEKA